jgi:tetratricopeptide (TPR) repeat protein
VLVNYGREEPDLIKKRALLEEARKKAEKATQCDAKYTEAWMVWGHAFFNLSESESDPNKKREELVEAAAKYKEAARLKPNYTNARYNWGCMSERLAVLEGDVKKKQALLEVAQDKYLGVEKDAHGFEWCLFDRARVAVLRGNKEEGRAMLEKSKLNLTIDVKDMQTNPAWDSVRAEAWFQALLK